MTTGVTALYSFSVFREYASLCISVNRESDLFAGVSSNQDASIGDMNKIISFITYENKLCLRLYKTITIQGVNTQNF